MSKIKAMFLKNIGGVSNYSSFTLASVNSGLFNNMVTPKGIHITNDGSKIFVQESGSADGIFRYDMSSAFDITSETFTNEKTKLLGADQPQACFFNPDGTHYFTIQSSQIFQATLSTPFDTSTQGTVTSYSFSGTMNGVWVKFNDDGFKMFARGVGDGSVQGIIEVVLSTAYDVTSSTSETTYLPPTDSLKFDSIVFVNNGLDILVMDAIDEEYDLINLSSAYDVSTMSDSVHNQTTGLTIMTNSSRDTVSYTDDTYIYILDSGSLKNIYQFSTSFII